MKTVPLCRQGARGRFRSFGFLLLLGWAVVPAPAQDEAAIQRGEYIFRASGGCSCHTDLKNQGPFLAGGRPLKTPFGVIYSTNITPDPKTGIGRWSDEDFMKAMTQGIGPDGTYYYPAFPFTSFTKMTERDLRDLKAYLFSVPPVERENKPPELRFPFNWRSGMVLWRSLYFRPGVFQPVPAHGEEWNRGAYLATAVAHCGECHTPRDSMGGLRTDLHFAGSREGPEGELAPNITPDPETGIGGWSLTDIVWFLQTGMEPDGDATEGLMNEVIEQGYHQMKEADLKAIAVYLKSLQPIRNRVSAEE